MRIQDLAIIFIIIILPISLVIASYTQYQIQTINTQTLYDSRLSSATYDAIRAFQINTNENKQSDLANSKIRDLEASISTFRNSIMSSFSLNGYSEDDLNSYIPALVYTLYDGFYIYSPYKNINYRYEDENGGTVTDVNNTSGGQKADDNGKNIYGLKPYISYSCRYKRGDIDVVITYALDNHVTVQGMIGNEYINKDGYLIDNIKEEGESIKYNGVNIETEVTKEYLPLNGDQIFSYIKLDNKKYYLDEGSRKIISRLNQNEITVQYSDEKEPQLYVAGRDAIFNNKLAQDYYKDALEFTKWFKTRGLQDLTYEDAYDIEIDSDGNIESGKKIWENNKNKIFEFNDGEDYSKNIENETSSFNQHRLAVIRHKIEVNLSIAISNYNNYSGATNVFQMPELKEDEWDNVIHNISLISFLQGIPIGGKTYNGYSIVTNSESEEVVLEQNIYILGTDKKANQNKYYRIGDRDLVNSDNVSISAGAYGNNSAGRLNLDFKRDILTTKDGARSLYFYPLSLYDASYNSIVMQNDVDTYDDIYIYVNESNDDLKKAFYTALGRERAGTYKTWSDYDGSNTDKENGELNKLLGDINGDGVVDQSDSDIILNSVRNGANLTEEQFKCADINKDGIVDMEDFYLLQDEINKNKTKWTITYKNDSTVIYTTEVEDGKNINVGNGNNTERKLFKCWSDGNRTYQPGETISNINKNITLTAIYELFGDVDGDGVLTDNDWGQLNNYLGRGFYLTTEQLKRADVNQDGKVDTNDARILQSWISYS